MFFIIETLGLILILLLKTKRFQTINNIMMMTFYV